MAGLEDDAALRVSVEGKWIQPCVSEQVSKSTSPEAGHPPVYGSSALSLPGALPVLHVVPTIMAHYTHQNASHQTRPTFPCLLLDLLPPLASLLLVGLAISSRMLLDELLREND